MFPVSLKKSWWFDKGFPGINNEDNETTLVSKEHVLLRSILLADQDCDRRV